MCLEATCGEKDLGTRLENRAVPHAWTFAPQLRLRQELGSRACNPRRGEEYVKEDVLAAFDKTVDWEKYAYRLKMAAQKMQRGTRGAAAAAARADDDDDWEESSVEDSYVVENAAEVQRTIPRSSLRHRVLVGQFHVGVKGDKRHDR